MSPHWLQEYPELLQTLLQNRGFITKEDTDRFLRPDYDRDTHDPFLLQDIQLACKRILEAQAQGEMIGVFSDYDADGIPGAVVLTDFFKKVGYENIEVYIPHRNREGFGLNTKALDVLAQKGVTLLITIDCGSANAKEITYATTKGIDVIVTDHHAVPEDRPVCAALVNPNQPGCSYPNKAICGAGVAFKLVQALLHMGDFTIVPGWEKWLLDMVGIATIADMVSLKEPENRALATYGLRVLRKSRRPGIQALCRMSRIDQRTLTEDDIGFTIGPRINAASRMDKPELAFALLSTDDPVEAKEVAKTLDHLNNERKGVVAAMTKEAKKKLASREHLQDVIVIGNPEWMPSLVGLVATSLLEAYARPIFVWGRDEKGTLKGSCRAPKGHNLFALMQALPADSCIEFGGHECSGGFSVTVDQVHHLEDRLAEALACSSNERVEHSGVDGELVLDRVTWETYKIIQTLAPFGVDNPKPQFTFSNVEIVDVTEFGKAKNHVAGKLQTKDGLVSVRVFRFFATPAMLPALIQDGVTGQLEKGFRNGAIEVRLV